MWITSLFLILIIISQAIIVDDCKIYGTPDGKSVEECMRKPLLEIKLNW